MNCSHQVRTVILASVAILAVILAPAVVADSDTSALSHVTKGADCHHPIGILATNEFTGVEAENEWLAQHYPHAQLVQQSLIGCDKIPEDDILMRAINGTYFHVYFDISHFFGE